MNTIGNFIPQLLLFAVVVGLIWFVVVSIFFERAVVETPTEVCPHCQYELKGLQAAGTCPECGGVYAAVVSRPKGWRFVPDRITVVAAALLLSALNYFAIVSIPRPVAFIAYRLTTDWPSRDCWIHAARAVRTNTDAFLLVLLFQTWIVCVVAVRAQSRRSALLALWVGVGGLLGLVAGCFSPGAWNQGMLTYFLTSPSPPTNYTNGALIGLALWCVVCRRSLQIGWGLTRDGAEKGSTKPPTATG